MVVVGDALQRPAGRGERTGRQREPRDEPDALRFARLQDRLNWLNRLVVQCDCNRQTLAAIEAEGFAVSRLERTTLPKAPKFVRPLIVGTAVA